MKEEKEQKNSGWDQADRSFVFMETFYRTAQEFEEPERRAAFYDAMARFGLYHEEAESDDPLLRIGMVHVKDSIGRSKNHREAAIENGKKGGRPKTVPPVEWVPVYRETGSIRETAERFGIAESTLRAWKKKVEEMYGSLDAIACAKNPENLNVNANDNANWNDNGNLNYHKDNKYNIDRSSKDLSYDGAQAHQREPFEEEAETEDEFPYGLAICTTDENNTREFPHVRDSETGKIRWPFLPWEDNIIHAETLTWETSYWRTYTEGNLTYRYYLGCDPKEYMPPYNPNELQKAVAIARLCEDSDEEAEKEKAYLEERKEPTSSGMMTEETKRLAEKADNGEGTAFVVFREYLESLEQLKYDHNKGAIALALMEYGTFGTISKDLPPIMNGIFTALTGVKVAA